MVPLCRYSMKEELFWYNCNPYQLIKMHYSRQWNWSVNWSHIARPSPCCRCLSLIDKWWCILRKTRLHKGQGQLGYIWYGAMTCGKKLTWNKMANRMPFANVLLTNYVLPFIISCNYTCNSFTNILPSNWFGLPYSPIFSVSNFSHMQCMIFTAVVWVIASDTCVQGKNILCIH